MSYSDSDSSSSYGAGGEYKNFKQISRERLLYEMLRSAKTGSSKSTWKVLIMDKLTVKIMSYSCKMADITQEGVSLVEDIHKRRQPLPSMDAIYFIQPTKENVVMFLSDMSGRSPLYKKAFVFFSSPISRDLVSHIKKDTTVLPRIGALREMNLEYFAIDSQGFVTDNERALEELFCDEENTRKGDACLNLMATRIATVFASLREFPFVRYRAAKSLDAMTMTTLRDLIPTKLAAGVWNHLVKYKQTIENFPQTETCELLILDRSVDQIAPIIHEWTYDAICRDLLNMEGNKYVHEVPSKTGGPPEKKEVLLEEHDPIWLELRHAHIADASERLHEKMTNFISKNKAAQLKHVSRDGGELSTKDLQKMVQALPQYSEQIDKISLHVEIAGKVNRIIRELELRELGQLEQDLAFGDAGLKDVIKYLTTKEDVTRENKLRLLMIVAAIYPEKFDGEKGLNLMKLAKLPPDDMAAVNNMRLLGGSSDGKKNPSGAFTLKFDIHKKKRGVRKDRNGEEPWQLSRFYPMIEELIEKLSKRELSKDDYPCMNDPSPSFHGTTQSTTVTQSPPAHSMRSRRTPTWARARTADDVDGYSSDPVLRHASSDFKKRGQRIFVFIVGGATRSELRVCHKLTTKLNREIVLGSTSLDDPPQFITKLKLLTADDLTLDDLQI
ncbi:SNARE-interacting protein KEULE-like [Mangifera indica]|uniref:SNARE-interacting protein KEULE-like n=1 Tax=Mangifera indica TaxID=29780 RepID=UPI001CF99422|nr:SNARE-interacting protein KEULE-like [Mangifera indica]